MQTDPTIAYHFTTAAVPEWAAEVTGDARDAAIARLRVQVDVMSQHVARHSERACKLAVELADVKAECCRLVDDNGDLEAEIARRDTTIAKLLNAGVAVRESSKDRVAKNHFGRGWSAVDDAALFALDHAVEDADADIRFAALTKAEEAQ